MKTLLLTLALTLGALAPASAQSLNDYRWKSRLVICFTPSPADPMFEQQLRLLYDEMDAFRERDVEFLLITPEGKFENTGLFLKEADARKFYERFGAAQYHFEMILVGYDGYEKFRAINQVTPPSVLIDLIDQMPMRQQELRRGKSNRSTAGQREGSPANIRRKF